MPPLSQDDMQEATRLTRQGRLEEAMALLQGGLRRPASATAADEPAGGPSRQAQPLIDMEPPHVGTDGAWTAPFAAGASSGGGKGAFPRRDVLAAMRGLMDRLGGSMTPNDLGNVPLRPPAPVTRHSPGALPAGARFEERVHANAAGSRPYRLYVPSTFRGRPLPLVVMLHGCTQSPEDFAAGTRMNELAEEFGLFVAYPGQTQAANMQKCWNWFNAADQVRDRGEPSLIAGITRATAEELPVQKGRIYVAGLSAGGAKAAIMGATYPDLYAAVGVHSGLACGAARDMPSAFSAMRQGSGAPGMRRGRAMPTIVFHGDRDATVSPVNGDEVAAQARAGAAHRAEVTRGRSPGGIDFTRTVHRSEAGSAMLEQWVLHGAGHAWSGGSEAGSYTDPRGPDASREMVRFFLTHDGAPGGS